MRWLATAVALLILGAGACGGAPPGVRTSVYVQTRGRELVGPDGAVLRLRGINLGNWLVPEGYMWRFEKGPQSPRQIQELVADLVGPDEARAFWSSWRDTYVTREDVQYLRKIGLNSVRVPFNYRLLTPEDRPGVWLDEGFVLLDRVIGWCREEGLWVILDMHCAPGGQTGTNIDDSWGWPSLFESAESQARTIEVWRKIAERYRGEPTILGYDLLNEPIPHWPEVQKYNPLLEPLYKRIVASVREVDPSHVVFLGGAQWDTNFAVFGPPFAPNLAYTFHKYWNETTDASIKSFLDFRDRHDVPLWLGESGENTDEWVAACVRLMEGHGVGWSFWPYKKMDATSSIVSVERPAHWDEIASYAAARGTDFEANNKLRPSLEHSRAALLGLVENSRFKNVRVNAGYVRALGLSP